jgi:O-antigen ligase
MELGLRARALRPALSPRSGPRDPDRHLAVIAASALALAAGLLVVYKFGTIGLGIALLLVLVVAVVQRPLAAVGLVVLLAALFEGPGFGILGFTSKLYSQLYHDVTVLDALVAIAVVSVALDVLLVGRSVRVPKPLVVPLGLLLLAMIAGAITGHAAGGSVRFVVFSEDVLAYLLLLPVAVANLRLNRRQLTWLIGAILAVAALKAVVGLGALVTGRSQTIEGSSRLTYYEPAANWLMMVALLTVVAAVSARARLPRWMLISAPLLFAALLLSYRRSFWIGAALALLLVVLLASSPTRRRAMLPAAMMIGAAIWLAGSVHFQSQLPIVKRVASLSPSKLEANAQDSYRLDERADVLATIGEHPLTGLGVTIPWRASARPLSVEHEEGRQYVHFAALWFWLKLGIVGLFAYIGVMIGGAVLAFQAWRRSHEPLLRAFALASLCGIAGVVVIDTTASFTGIDARFTVLFAAQLGLLAQLVRTAPARSAGAPGTAALE